MSNWTESFECPKCGSKDTRFVEPRYEISVYACNVCVLFEIEEE